MGKYSPILEAVKLKGSNEFSRSELIGIITFKLSLLGVKEAKRLVEEAIKEGIIEERGELLVVNLQVAEEEEEGDVLGEIVTYIARELGMTEMEVMEELREFGRRYGNLDMKLVAYLYGLEKGLDMSPFRDRLEG
ncbi:DUF2240 family protein [Pyrococcus yayanosii]|uniref:DUF2240 family protein n=1 Tax=Pyrococcus yayanosii (strain CH1 / JCM 16557) TaxID=529709 RepID=F8AIA3_PYRYC|nr:DUF2240 family protein [Pyrococcus yayanosii]AEH24340.1 hypothetical protein PYCH_06520 [Pyrococcus yayanosii CH1]